MERNAQELLGKLRAEIRRMEAAPSSASLGVLSSGFAALDGLLPGGGLPAGRVVELCGEPASGKTTLCLMALAQATRAEKLVAWVDPCRELYPPAAQALGADLSRMLLVRPNDPSLALRAASMLARSGAFAAVAVDVASREALPKGPLGRRLLEAAESGRTAVVLLSNGPSGLDSSLRVAVHRESETGLLLEVDRNRLGAPGRSARGELPDPEAPPAKAAKSALRRLRVVEDAPEKSGGSHG